MSNHHESKAPAMQAIPSIDQLLRTPDLARLRKSVGLPHLRSLAREVVDELREQLQANGLKDATRAALMSQAVKRIQSRCEHESLSALRRVINATGVIVHTNLGRAPLSELARKAVLEEAAAYCTLEYDPAIGERGRRGAYVEELLIQLTGAEDALVVNNCAAAALLILTVLAGDGETIVSRGELVEIGGDFRVPEVMANSGTRMVEVGSTNRTRLEDYKGAVNENTRLIMRVHPSNYRIVGFTDSPSLASLASLAHESGLPLYEDAGSGVLTDLSAYGVTDEPIIKDSIAAGADVVSFSGDKLLGAAQAGLIVGRGEIIERLRKHSLSRALRVNKLCLAALGATLDSHRRNAHEEIPTLQMLAVSVSSIEDRARKFLAKLDERPAKTLSAALIPGESAIGGGSGPNVHPPTTLIAFGHKELNADEVQRRLRFFSPPVIVRIADEQILIDLRTVDPHEESELLAALVALDM